MRSGIWVRRTRELLRGGGALAVLMKTTLDLPRAACYDVSTVAQVFSRPRSLVRCEVLVQLKVKTFSLLPRGVLEGPCWAVFLRSPPRVRPSVFPELSIVGSNISASC